MLPTPYESSLADEIIKDTICMDIRRHKSDSDIMLDVCFPRILSDDDKLVIELLRSNEWSK